MLLAASCNPAEPPSNESDTSLPEPAHPERVSEEQAVLFESISADLRADPTDPTLLATLGAAYQANGFWSAGRAAYERAAERDPGTPFWLLHAGICASENGDHDDALAAFETLCARFSDIAPLWQRYGEALLDAGRLAEARRAFGETIRLAPEHPHGHVGLGDAWLRAGRPEDAVAPLQRAIDLDGEYRLPHFLLGEAFRALERPADALRELELGRDAGRRFLGDPWSERLDGLIADPARRRARADAHMKSGSYTRALPLLERALLEDPRDVASLVQLGAAFDALGQTAEARRALERARATAPGDARVLELGRLLEGR